MNGNENKPRIGIFGRRNYGKSSLINFITNQAIAIVSPQAGTTTDPVRKSMEIGGVGPVVLVDTAGIDDEGSLGRERVDRSLRVLPEVDLAIILFTANRFGRDERQLVQQCRERGIPFVLVFSQTDRYTPDNELIASVEREYGTSVFALNVADEALRQPLLDRIRMALPESSFRHQSLLGDVLSAGDTVIMVTPIDSSAPEGRMILPQVQVLRDVLDNHASAVVCREDELPKTLANLRQPPRLVVTDSQVYPLVARIVPDEVYLTSFSVVLARAKGLFDKYIEGALTIPALRDGDRVLLLESCTHNVTCEDIGRVKLPARLKAVTHRQLQCDVLGGASPIERPLADYALVIQCGGCVVTRRQLQARLEPALQAGVPVTNYGLALAQLAGILKRSIRIFGY